MSAHLSLSHSLQLNWDNPPAAAFSALTACSKLRLLKRGCRLPAGALQHLFPFGRRLPHLTSLDLARITTVPTFEDASAPDGSRLVRCCPGLQLLDMRQLQCSAELLAPLQQLSGLHALRVKAGDALGAVAQLIGLQKLDLDDMCIPDRLALQLTQLRQLTRLCYTAEDGNPYVERKHRHFEVQVSVGNQLPR